MADEERQNGTWKTAAMLLGAIVSAVALVTSIFTAGMNYQRGSDQQAQIMELRDSLERNYMRRDLVESHLLSLQQGLNRIERAIAQVTP